MRGYATLCLILAKAATVVGQSPDAQGRYTISSTGIKAQFITYGATLTNLFVKDKNGQEVDVVLGYDNTSYYPVDPGHPVYNAIPGRYVNRIGHGQYTMDNQTYFTEQNDGNNTLHSGSNNWSYQFWNVTSVTEDSITFSISSPANSEKGMPGLVDASVTYSVAGSTWNIKMEARAPETRTPLMLTQHTYFNLDAYKDPATSQIWNHTLHMPFSSKYLEADASALPTGNVLDAFAGSTNDFASAPDIRLGHAQESPDFANNCGSGCEGYNGFYVIENPETGTTVATLASTFSGIKADLMTDQAGLIIYTCNWMDGSADLKSTQGTETVRKVGKSSCIAIEPQDWVDGINHPEWNRKEAQITGPGEVYSWDSSWTFGLLDE